MKDKPKIPKWKKLKPKKLIGLIFKNARTGQEYKMQAVSKSGLVTYTDVNNENFVNSLNIKTFKNLFKLVESSIPNGDSELYI